MIDFLIKHKLLKVVTRNWLALFLLISAPSYSQQIVEYRGKKYEVYRTLMEANKVHPDSVEGLWLISNGYKDFPRELLKFKNLRYLEISSYYWYEVLDSLTPRQRKKYYKLEKETCDRYMIYRFYKPNTIVSFPKEISELNKLEVCFFVNTPIRSWKKYIKIFDYLPNTHILPPKEGF
jgi:hypothetical protein